MIFRGRILLLENMWLFSISWRSFSCSMLRRRRRSIATAITTTASDTNATSRNVVLLVDDVLCGRCGSRSTKELLHILLILDSTNHFSFAD